MKTCSIISVIFVLIICTSSFSRAQNQYEKEVIGIGYDASIFGLWMLELNFKINVTNRISFEGIAGLGGDRITKDDGLIFTNISTKGMFEFVRGNRANLYAYILPRFLWGSEEAIGSKNREPEFSLGLGTGLGTEACNGYFMELGFIKTNRIASFTLQAGKHFYF